MRWLCQQGVEKQVPKDNIKYRLNVKVTFLKHQRGNKEVRNHQAKLRRQGRSGGINLPLKSVFAPAACGCRRNSYNLSGSSDSLTGLGGPVKVWGHPEVRALIYHLVL